MALSQIALAPVASAQSALTGDHHAQTAGSASGGIVAKNDAHLNLPLRFEPEIGQTGKLLPGEFHGYSASYRVQLKHGDAIIETPRGPGKAELPAAVDLKFVGADRNAAIRGEEQLPGTSNYFVGQDPKAWVTRVPTYAKVRYAGIYPGVDLTFYGNDDRLEYDFVVSAGSDTDRLRMQVGSGKDVLLDAEGNLLLRKDGSVKLLKPVAYQSSESPSQRRLIDVRYAMHRGIDGKSEVRFELGAYDHSQPLVIDPVLVYGSYLEYGNQGWSGSYYTHMAMDAAGNSYFTGTFSSASPGAFQILKLNAAGSVVYTAALGSFGQSLSANALAVDAKGEVFIAGNAGAGLPTTASAFQPSVASTNAYDAFLIKISTDGSQLLYGSYLGGSYSDNGYSVAVDATGKAFVAGSASSTDFPVTSGAYLTNPGTGYSTNGSAFVAAFNPAASGKASLVYSTYLSPGGSNNGAWGVAVDAQSEAIVAVDGEAGYPVTNGAYYYSNGSQTGTYITKLNATGTALKYSAYLGPGSVAGLAIDGGGNVYVAGSVNSADFPTTPGAYNGKYAGGFASKLSADASTLVYSTFLGGPSSFANGSVRPTGIAIPANCAANCSAFVTGTTTTTDFPMIQPIQTFLPAPSSQNPYPPSTPVAAFLVALANNGKSAAYSTYLSGGYAAPVSSPSIAVDSAQNVYLAFSVSGSDMPITAPLLAGAPLAQNLYYSFPYFAKISPANAAKVLVTPPYYDFNYQTVGLSTTYNTQQPQVMLRNLGSAAATLTRPFVSSSREFSETDNCGTTLAAGADCVLNLIFTPAASGQRNGKLTIASNGQGSPASLTLTGYGYDSYAVVPSKPVINFGNQAVATASAAQTVTLTNVGNEPLPIGTLTLIDASSAGVSTAFTLATTCGAQIAPKASCTATFKFQPAELAAYGAVLRDILPDGTWYFMGVQLQGNGVLRSGRVGALVLSATSLNFGSNLVGTQTQDQQFTVTNDGAVPVVIYSVAVTTTGQSSSSVFAAESTYCLGRDTSGNYTIPQTLEPQSSCTISVHMTPSAATIQTGKVTITDSSAAGTHSVALSGLGIAQTQSLVFSPKSMSFPSQPVGDPSAPQGFYVFNEGTAPVTIDRLIVTGDFQISQSYSGCEGVVLQSVSMASYSDSSSCSVNITFTPTATGLRTGTLSLIDTASGTSQQFSLSGVGITATGTLNTGVSTLPFPPEPKGTTSPAQEITIVNPGNAPVQLNAYTVTGDFALDPATGTCNGSLPLVVQPQMQCTFAFTMTPTKASGAEMGTLTFHSSAGTTTVALTGSAIPTTQVLSLSPASVAFGPIGVNKITGIDIYLQNTGSGIVTINGNPVITPRPGTGASEFSNLTSTCTKYVFPGYACTMTVAFSPSSAGAKSATWSVSTTAGTKTVAITGTGVTTPPQLTLNPATRSFPGSPVGVATAYYGTAVQVSNTGGGSITVSSAKITSGSTDFVIPPGYDHCSGLALTTNTCSIYLQMIPTVAGLRTGVLTVTDSKGKTYTSALSGLGIVDIDSSTITATTLAFSPTAAGNYVQTIPLTISNTGNSAYSIGTVTGTDVSYSSVLADFSFNEDYSCAFTVAPNHDCTISVTFSPLTAGAKTGLLKIPITYSDNKTVTYQVALSGTGVADSDSAKFTPASLAFPNIVLGSSNTSASQTLSLSNTGNNMATIVSVTGANYGTNTSDFTGSTSGSGACEYNYVEPNSSCSLQVNFTPKTAGTHTGTVSVLLKYEDGKQVTVTASLSGTASAGTKTVAITPGSGQFNVEVAGTSDPTNVLTFNFAATGTAGVTVSGVALNNPNFTIVSDYCTHATVAKSSYFQPSCNVVVGFSPTAATAPGTVQGTLTITSDATSGTHTATFSGQVISAGQELVLSQSSVAFATQTSGSVSPGVDVLLTDQTSKSQQVMIRSITLGGKNPSSFQESQTCGGNLGFSLAGRTVCVIHVAFAPGATTAGGQAAAVTIVPAQGPTLVLNLSGTSTLTHSAIQ